MWMLAVGDYMKHAKRNLFIALQVSILLFVVIIMMATLHRELYLYQPISELSGKAGVVYKNTGYHAMSKEQLTKGLKKVEKVLAYGSAGFFNQSKDTYYSSGVYGDDLIEHFEPEMSEGRWLDTQQSGEISVVVSQNDQNQKTGDVITLYYVDANQKEKSIQAKICGVLQEGTTLFGRSLGQGEEFHHDYRDLYSAYRFQQEQATLYLFSESQLEKAGVSIDYNSDYIISYQDDITRMEVRQNQSQLLENGEAATYAVGDTSVTPLDDFMSQSHKEIVRNLMMYLPVLLCIFLVTLISIINVCTLNTRESYRQNAVFYLLGLNWKKCSFFAVLQNAITMLVAILFSIVYLSGLKISNMTTLFYTEIYGETVVTILFVLLVLFSISIMISRKMLKRKQPVEILRQERI